MVEIKGKYYTELGNSIANFNDNNYAPLSNTNIWEAIVEFVMENEEGSITDASNVTDDAFRHASSSQR